MPRPVDSPYDEGKPWLDQSRRETMATQIVVFSESVTLDNDDIKLLPSTPFEVIAAPGEGKFIVPIGGAVQFDTAAGAYSNVDIDGAVGMFFVVGSTTALGVPTLALVRHALVAGVAHDFLLTPTNVGTYIATDEEVELGLVLAGAPKSSIQMSPANQPLSVYIDNYNSAYEIDHGNFTGGHVDNSLKITILYTIVDV